MLAKLLDVKPGTPRAVPDAMPMHEVLAHCDPLTRLQARLEDARARMAAIRPLLPPSLASCVQAGPPDDMGWTLLVPTAAVGAKLRQLLPRLERALLEKGWQGNAIRIRIQS